MAQWLHDMVTVWHSDCISLWLYGTVTALHGDCVAQWLHCTVTVWHSDCTAQWLYGTVTALHSDRMAQWLRCMVSVWHSDCTARWLYCTVTALHSDCMAQCLHFTLIVWHSACLSQWLYGTVAALHSDCMAQWLPCTVTVWLSDALHGDCMARWLYGTVNECMMHWLIVQTEQLWNDLNGAEYSVDHVVLSLMPWVIVWNLVPRKVKSTLIGQAREDCANCRQCCILHDTVTGCVYIFSSAYCLNDEVYDVMCCGWWWGWLWCVSVCDVSINWVMIWEHVIWCGNWKFVCDFVFFFSLSLNKSIIYEFKLGCHSFLSHAVNKV